MKKPQRHFRLIYPYVVDDSLVFALDYHMNCKQRVRTFPGKLVLILLLTVSFFGSEGTLLCFGEDGHVAVEFVDACNNSAADSQLGSVASDECGPCRDVDFPNVAAYMKNPIQYVQALPSIFSTSIFPATHSGEHLNASKVMHAHLLERTLGSPYLAVLLI